MYATLLTWTLRGENVQKGSRKKQMSWKKKMEAGGKFLSFSHLLPFGTDSTPTSLLFNREYCINHEFLLYLSWNLHSTNLINCSYFVCFLQFISQAAWIILIANIQDKITYASLKIKTLQPTFLTCTEICLGLFSSKPNFLPMSPSSSMYLIPSPIPYFFWLCDEYNRGLLHCYYVLFFLTKSSINFFYRIP